MSRLRNSYLSTTIWGLAAIGFIQASFSYFIPAWIRNYSACYKEAVKCLREHPEGIKILGEPIIEKKINITNKTNDNSANCDFAWFTVPVEGSKSSGKLRYWIVRSTKDENKWFGVTRIELEPTDSPNRSLLIKQQIMVSNRTLILTAAYGAFGVSTFGLIVKYHLQNTVRNSLCYKEALEYLNNHPEAQKQLGQPIEDGRINLGNTVGNGGDETRICYTVSIKGPKSKGSMTYYVTKVDETEKKYKVTRVELDLDHIKDRKLLIKNIPM